MYDFLIIGGGIFGVSTAIELAKRKHKVGLLNPDKIPHHLAASTDVTKAVRMEYGSDTEYFQMAEICIDRWHEWNDLFKEQLYHEVGLLMLCKDSMEQSTRSYEKASFDNLVSSGYKTDRLDAQALSERFPAFNPEVYKDSNYNPRAGYVESGRVVELMTAYARSLGVNIHESQTAEEFVIDKGQLTGVKSREGSTFNCGHAIVAAGAHTPYLVPELKPYMKTTGHPVFWLKCDSPTNFKPPKMAVFMAEISNTGWYGFPFLEKHGIVKVAKHTHGQNIHPDQNDRRVSDEEVEDMRRFIEESLPDLSNAPLVYTRKCLYTDTLDGHFWIDHHPEIKGLSVSSGGSGHGMKMGPILGEMTADMAEGKSHRFSDRYRWRHLTTDTVHSEEARFVMDRRI
ncbi:MAG: FAD-dependent oxidoreductase [Bacteroidia bacterium]|nr:FAD-dependent oxidoreductase [Bacteroidia bacterium]